MSVDPEPESTAEPQSALDLQADNSGPEDDLGDAGKTKGSDFTDPLPGL